MHIRIYEAAMRGCINTCIIACGVHTSLVLYILFIPLTKSQNLHSYRTLKMIAGQCVNPPPPPTHTHTHPPCRTHKQKLLRRLVYNFTMNYLPYFISLVVQSLTARLDVQILHGMSACVTHLKVTGTCSWIKLVCHKLSCVTFLQKATRVLRQPVSTEGIWLPYITVNLLQYTVEWQ